jgi:hypothetical protein
MSMNGLILAIILAITASMPIPAHSQRIHSAPSARPLEMPRAIEVPRALPQATIPDGPVQRVDPPPPPRVDVRPDGPPARCLCYYGGMAYCTTDCCNVSGTARCN